MSAILTFSSRAPSPHIAVLNSLSQKSISSYSTRLKLPRVTTRFAPKSFPVTSKTHVPTIFKFSSAHSISSSCDSYDLETPDDFEWGNQEPKDTEELDSPWEGAIVYKRNPSISHLEYCTTLERLGFGNLSTAVSRSKASVMGLRVTKAVKDYPLGTPVQISIDVVRKKNRLRLDGITRTVLTLACNRCGEPAAECIFSNFSLLLTEEPVEEPDIINIVYDQGKNRTLSGSGEAEEEDDDDSLIDFDDRLYFPPEEKEIDISKNVRDMIHVEITINALCDAVCKGICLSCGTNLNTSSCNCDKEQVEEKVFGPLGDLRKQIQQTKRSILESN